MASIVGALSTFVLAIPRLIGFALILLIGWFVAGLIGAAVNKLLDAVRFDDLAQRSGITGFTQKMGVKAAPSDTMGAIVRWFVRLIALIVAFDALGLPAVSQVLQQFLLWIPNLVVALVILIVAGLIATALSNIVRGAAAQAGLSNPNLLAGITSAAVWGFAIVVAVNQIGVATALVNTLFMGLVGALALALGLAFGLGGRDTAAEIVRNWYQSSREAAPKLERAADAVPQAAQREAQRYAPSPAPASPAGPRPGPSPMIASGQPGAAYPQAPGQPQAPAYPQVPGQPQPPNYPQTPGDPQAPGYRARPDSGPPTPPGPANPTPPDWTRR
jgi:hypothetical protein